MTRYAASDAPRTWEEIKRATTERLAHKPVEVPSLSQPTPAWGWFFAVACGIIPVLTLGGAIPTGVGLGGAQMCLTVARSRSLPGLVQVFLCLTITASCWIIVAATLVGLAILLH
jgi:hypothetical protein